MNKEINRNLAAIVIALFSLAVCIYAVYKIDVESFELSIQNLLLPVIFILMIILLLFKLVSRRDIDITSQKIDKKICDAIDRFNDRTGGIQNFVIGLIVFVVLVFYLMINFWPKLLH